MKKDMRSSFLAQFRADRATAVSDIIVRVAADDLRQTQRQRPMGCRSMRGPRFSLYRASGEYRAECLGLFCCMPSQPPRRAYAGIRQLALQQLLKSIPLQYYYF